MRAKLSHEVEDRAGENGFVSLFSVLFFMMLITIITIGFLRVIGVEQRQALDKDLSNGALTTAETGVEEAKRALIKYASLDPNSSDKGHWRSVFNSGGCNALFSDNLIRNTLNLNPSGQVGQTALNQFTTCLTINLSSADYESHNSAGKSEFIPLKHDPSQTFDQIRVSWHLLSNSVGTDGDGVPADYPPDSLLPPVTGNNGDNWTNNGFPAYMRVELYGYPNGTFSRSDIDNRTHSLVLVPGTTGVTANTPIALDTIDPRGIDQFKPGAQSVICQSLNNPPIGSYACTATLQLPADPSLRGNNNNYFLRVTPLYGSVHFKVEMLKSGSVINFNEVQPTIDSTGRVKDVFRRVQTRVRLDLSGNVPEYSAETVNDICKDMKVSDGSYYQNNCANLP